MDLGEVLKTYLGDGQQGQLVIKFVGESHLCKISIENGQAIYLTLGAKGPTETLDTIVGKVAEWNNFINGLPARKRLENPVNQRLLDIAGVAPLAEGEIPLAEATLEEEDFQAEVVNEGAEVNAGEITAVTNRFIDLVGPLASILIEKIFSNLAHIDGATMNAATYSRFISALAAEVPEVDRQAFVDAAAQ